MKSTKKRKPAKKKTKKKTKTTSGQRFRTKVAALCKYHLIDEDNDGQIVIYTGLYDDGNDNYGSFDEYFGEGAGMAWKEGQQYEPGVILYEECE